GMVADALTEEGDLAAAHELLDVDDGTKAIDALYAGEWDLFLEAAESFLATPGTGPSRPGRTAWQNLRVRCARGWLRAMRGDSDGGRQDAETALRTARSTSFWRPMWTALGHSALCSALLGEHDHAARLLGELGESWRRMRTIASGSWVAAAAH